MESDEEDEAEGIEIEDDFFSNPYILDPVLDPNLPLAHDVQGAAGNQFIIILEAL